MLDWITRRRERRIVSRATDEILQFSLRLRGFDVREIAAVAAQSAHVAYEFSLKFGVDLRDPQQVMIDDPSILTEMTETVIRGQQQAKFGLTPGFMVWIHTLRSEQIPEIRYLAKEMWMMLERGFDDAQIAASELGQTVGVRLTVVDSFLAIPRGYRIA